MTDHEQIERPNPSSSDLASLPVDELGIWLLGTFLSSKRSTFDRKSTLDQVLKDLGLRTPGDRAYDLPAGDGPVHPGRALAEAWEWLRSEALVAEAATGALYGHLPIDGFFFVTRLGHRVAAHRDATGWLRAQRRLGITMHPRLEERARRQFVLGEFAAAAFVAMREVEISVREHGNFGHDDIGVALMNRAFNTKSGPLTDMETPAAEQDGMLALFRGAMQVFKNPASHRRVDFDDPAEAAEIVLFADLLLRMIDRASARR